MKVENISSKENEKFESITIFINRMKKIGVEIELTGNFPWIYIDKINGEKVKEFFLANHGFTLAFYPVKENQKLTFTDIKEIFNLIRKYKAKGKASSNGNLNDFNYNLAINGSNYITSSKIDDVWQCTGCVGHFNNNLCELLKKYVNKKNPGYHCPTNFIWVCEK